MAWDREMAGPGIEKRLGLFGIERRLGPGIEKRLGFFWDREKPGTWDREKAGTWNRKKVKTWEREGRDLG